MNNDNPTLCFYILIENAELEKQNLQLALKISPLNDFKLFNNSYYKKTSNVSSVFTYQVIWVVLYFVCLCFRTMNIW